MQAAVEVRDSMMEYGIRSPLSQCPFQLELLYGSEVIATATAFFYVSGQDRSFLITNWHNVSGRHYMTKHPIMSGVGTAVFPTHLRAKLMSDTGRTDTNGSSLLDVRNTDLSLYDHNHRPLWFEHPHLGSHCDIVALPFARPGTVCPEFHRAANTVSPMRVPVVPGGTVFIIGYPLGISISVGLPVWKSGYIASEPHFPVTLRGSMLLTVPAFFIDSQTRKGMSGSPVFAEYVGSWNSADPYAWDGDDPTFLAQPNVMIGSRGVEFVGCYGGRIPGEGVEDAALGLCWTQTAIEDVCRGQKRGDNPQVTRAS